MTQQTTHPITVIKDQIETTQISKRLKDLATPKMTVQAMHDSIIMACRDNPDILTFNTNEILSIFIKSFQWGVLPNTVHQHAYILPNKGYTTQNGKKVPPCLQLQLSYKGMMELLRRNEVEIKSGMIYENDEWEYGENGFDTIFRLKRAIGDRGKSTHFYALAKTANDLFVEVLDKKEIERISKTAKTNKVWNSHWDEMARKTAIKRLVKHVGFTDRLSKETIQAFQEDTEQVYDYDSQQAPTPIHQQPITDEQFSEITTIIDHSGADIVEIVKNFNVKSVKELNQGQFKSLKSALQKQIQDRDNENENQ